MSEKLYGTTVCDETHVSPAEAGLAQDVTDATPDELPAPGLREPVALATGVGLVGTAATLIAAGVPAWAAVVLLLGLAALGAWERSRVMPVR